MQIALGGAHTCARIDDGTVYCWGDGHLGQLGDGSPFSKGAPTIVPGLTEVVEIAAGDEHSCARKADGSVWCWGQTAHYVGHSTPTVVSGLTGVTQLSCGYHFTCARQTDGTAWCWGDNYYGQIGDGTVAFRAEPTKVALGDVVEIAAGGIHTCARNSLGHLYCWGYGQSGELGDGSFGNGYHEVSPTLVPGLQVAAQVAAGENHTCARLDGMVWCWGDNDSGELGDGTVVAKHSPVKVVGLADAVDIRLGVLHSCARRTDGTLWCWGSSAWGQLGDGPKYGGHVSPVMVPGLTGVVMLSLGAYHTCAVASGGAMSCWGFNGDGQLGDGTKQHAASPMLVKW